MLELPSLDSLKQKGAKINLHVNLQAFRAAKLKGFTIYLSTKFGRFFVNPKLLYAMDIPGYPFPLPLPIKNLLHIVFRENKHCPLLYVLLYAVCVNALCYAMFSIIQR